MAIEIKHTTAADGSFSTLGATEWNRAHSITGLTADALLYASDATTLAQSANLTFNVGTGTLSALIFSGAGTGLTGTATGLTAGVASAVAVGGITGLGTGVGTALAVNVGTAGAPVVNGGALGTPSSGTLTNCAFPTLNQNTFGTAAGLSATLVVGSGGTGLATIADAAMLATNSANVLTAVVAGASQALRRNAGNTAWEAFTPAAGASGSITASGYTQNTARLLGRNTAAVGAIEEITLGTNLSFAGTTLNSTAGSGATLDGITAATADQAGIANADWSVVWNWQKITNSEVAFTLGETAAATNGTSTSGVPNQILLKLATLAASTMSPLSVYSRGAHVFSVSPTTPQILLGNDSDFTNPPLAFASAPGLGFGYDTSGITISSGGARVYRFDAGVARLPAGSAGAPGIQGWGIGNAGLFFPSTVVGISISAVENSRFSAGTFQSSKGSADAVSYALNFRKSRGTVASPTVITTGDDLATISGYGYLGATNTYELAAQIKYDSIGTIADTTSGIGGVIRFSTANQGVVGVVECMTAWNTGDVTIGLPSPATTAAVGFPQIPTMAGTPTGVPTVITGFAPMVYDTTGDKIWLYDYGAAAWKGVGVA